MACVGYTLSGQVCVGNTGTCNGDTAALAFDGTCDVDGVAKCSQKECRQEAGGHAV
jgi:hypothetical protein